MTLDLLALRFDAHDPVRLGRFWADVLGQELLDDPNGGVCLVPAGAVELQIRFAPNREIKTVPNQMHFDLTSTSLAD